MSELIGLLPAAGRGSRLGAIPCSKEIMPLGFQLQPTAGGARWRPVTAIETHLRALKLAGAARAAIVISETKSDVVRYIGDGSRYDLPVAYLYQQQLRGMPFALDLAAPWIGAATTLFSMPDTLITPVETMARLARRHQSCAADLTLGLFRTDTPGKFGMVELDASGAVVGFVDKPVDSNLELMWGLAAWSARFTRFLGEFLAHRAPDGLECVLSDVFLAALQSGLAVQALLLEDARYHDIGTPEDFQAVVFELALQQAVPVE
jgi:glucose-1-phosphate thymidylyltransferase